MHKKRSLVFLSGLVVILSGVLLVARADLTNNTSAGKEHSCPGLMLNQQCFKVESANTEIQRQKGLSGRDSLPQDRAMLFTFDSPSKQCIWMRDMKFSIDVIWLDAQKKVLRIENNVVPETYPATFCADNTKYVVEINAGLAKSIGLTLGDTAQL